MKMFYRLKNQRAQGPFSLEEMLHWVRTEELTALDPIFREGDEKWRPLSEFAEFRSVLKEIKVKKDQDSWVVLVKKEPGKKTGYLQKGPFSTDQIREMLQKGEILYTDHIWKKGMSEWKKVSAVENFNPSTPTWDLPPPPQIFPPPEDTSKEELLKKVIKKPQVPLQEPKPSEASGEDLIHKTIVAPPSQQHIHITVNQPSPPALTPVPVPAPTAKKSESLPEKTKVRISISEDDEGSNWWIHLIIIGLVMGFAGYYLMVTSKPEPDGELPLPPSVTSTAEPEPQPSYEPEPEPPPAPQPQPQVEVQPAPQPTAPVSNVVRAPRTLKMETGGRRNGKITVKSDASPHFDLKVELTAGFGDVVGKRSEKRKRIFQKVSFPYELDLANIVAPGFYTIQLELGEKTYKSKVWVNSSGKELRPMLQKYVKQNVFGFISEKRKLVRILKKWQDSGQPDPFGEVAEFNRKNRSDLYYLPQFWTEAYELYAKPKGNQWTKAVQKLRSSVLYSHPYGTIR